MNNIKKTTLTLFITACTSSFGAQNFPNLTLKNLSDKTGKVTLSPVSCGNHTTPFTFPLNQLDQPQKFLLNKISGINLDNFKESNFLLKRLKNMGILKSTQKPESSFDLTTAKEFKITIEGKNTDWTNIDPNNVYQIRFVDDEIRIFAIPKLSIP